MMDKCRCWGPGGLQQQEVQQVQQESSDSTIQQTNQLGIALSRAEVWSQQGLEKHAGDNTPSLSRESVRSEQQQSNPADP